MELHVVDAREELSDDRDVVSRIETTGDQVSQLVRGEEIESTEFRTILLSQIEVQLGEQFILQSRESFGVTSKM